MKAIVTISGYGDKTIRTMSFVEHIKKLSEKECPKVVFLPTAGFDNFTPETEAYQDFVDAGCDVHVLKLSEYKKGSKKLEKIVMSADIIYAIGGNLMRVMSEFTRTGADELFRRAHEENGAILCGISSGAMCWYDRGYDDCGLDGSFMFVKCLGFLPYSFCPHYNSTKWKTYTEAVKYQKFPGISAEDGAAIEFKDGKYRVLHEMEDRHAYLFHPNADYKKTRLNKKATLLNEGVPAKDNE